MNRKQDRAPIETPYTIQSDAVGRLRYSPTSSSANAVSGFERFQRVVLEHGPASGLAAHLLAFESIFTTQELQTAVQACSNSCFQAGDEVYLDWQRNNEWRDQRLLGNTTLASIKKTTGSLQNVDSAALCHLAHQANPSWQHLSPNDTIDHLFSAGRAWAVFTLPPMLTAHVLGDAPLQPLPRSALARRETKHALTFQHRQVQDFKPEHAEALDVAFSGSVGSDLGLIEELVKACGIGKQNQGSAQHRRERIQKRLASLSSRARSWTDGLLVGWAIHLLQVGTRSKAILAPGTIANYVSALAYPLATVLGQQADLPTSAQAWADIYQETHERIHGSMRDAASARSSFHDYLMFNFGIDPLPALHGWEHEERPPHANILWPHEFDQIQQWFADAKGDQRLVSTLSLILHLARTARLRTHEVLHLRLRNIIPYEQEFEVYPLPKDGPGKSASAARMLSLDFETAQHLHSWVARRIAEGATTNDYLFGDPFHPERIYRPGATTTAMINLLRHVTGEPDVVFHTTSHTWISQAITQMHEFSEGADIDPLDQIAAAAGHFSASTLRHYYHSYPSWLRKSIDEAIDRSSLVSSNIASSYIQASPAALRQRKARSKDRTLTYWRLIRDTPVELPLPCAAETFKLTAPAPPTWISTPRHNDVDQIANILEDVACGNPLGRIVLRSGFSNDEINLVIERALRTLRAIGAWKPDQRIAHIKPDTAVLRYEAWRQTPSAQPFSFRRRHQEKFSTITKRLPDVGSPVWRGWIEGFERGYLRLERENASALFHWLAECGTPPLRLALSAETLAIDSPKTEDLKQIFKIAFGVAPLVFPHLPGEGRPEFYLIWSSETIGELRPSPARSSLAGLHVWMLATSCSLKPPLPLD